MNMSKLTTLALVGLLNIGVVATAHAQRKPAGPAPQQNPISVQSASVSNPNGRGCAAGTYKSQCFTNFDSAYEATKSCRGNLWDEGSYAYVRAERYLCLHRVARRFAM